MSQAPPAFGRRPFQVTSVLALALAATACGASTDEESTDDSVAAMSALGESSDVAHAHEMGGIHAMDGALYEPRLEGGLRALRCDASPEIMTTDVCGTALPSSAHYEWTSCEPATRPDGSGSPHKGDETATGSADIVSSYALDADSCEANTTLTTTRTTTFSFDRGGLEGRRMQESGTSVSTSTRTLDNATTFTETNQVDTVRTRLDAEGAVEGSLHLTGTMTVAFEGSGDTLQRTFNGRLNSTVDDRTSSSVELQNVVRVPPSTCFWPISGTVLRNDAEGTIHTLTFSSTCGEATLDGETIALKDRGGRGHGRGAPRIARQ